MMDFENIKESAYDKATKRAVKQFVKQEKDDLAKSLEQDDPELSKLVDESRVNQILMREIAIASIEEYHSALLLKLKSKGINLEE